MLVLRCSRGLSLPGVAGLLQLLVDGVRRLVLLQQRMCTSVVQKELGHARALLEHFPDFRNDCNILQGREEQAGCQGIEVHGKACHAMAHHKSPSRKG